MRKMLIKRWHATRVISKTCLRLLQNDVTALSVVDNSNQGVSPWFFYHPKKGWQFTNAQTSSIGNNYGMRIKPEYYIFHCHFHSANFFRGLLRGLIKLSMNTFGRLTKQTKQLDWKAFKRPKVRVKLACCSLLGLRPRWNKFDSDTIISSFPRRCFEFCRLCQSRYCF